MRNQITSVGAADQSSIRELCFDEIEMVGGGFGLPHINWGAIEHKASSIVHTAISNAETHNWKQVGSAATTGAGLGGSFAGGWGAAIGGLAFADYTLYRQDFG
jgi:hypothetical protein